MFSGLRHDSIISRDHQQGIINRSYSSEHIVNKICVARNIDKPNNISGGYIIFRSREIIVGVTKVNAEATLFFFAKCVCISASNFIN